MNLTHLPSVIVRNYLVQENVVGLPDSTFWPGYAEGLQHEIDDMVAINTTEGVLDGRNQKTGEYWHHPGLQIHVRGKKMEEAWERINAVKKKLEEAYRVTVAVEAASYVLVACRLTSDILNIGRDENGRKNLTLNLTITVENV